MRSRAPSPPCWPAIAAASLAANLCVQQLPALPGAQWLVPLALAAVLCWRHAATRPLGLGLVAFAWTAMHAAAALDDRLPPALSGEDFSVVGWVDDFPDRDAERSVFSLSVEQASDRRVPKRLRLTWYDAPLDIAAGDALSLTVRLRRPRGLVNPGGFDYERWLLLEGYGATGYVRAFATETPEPRNLRRELLRWRASLARSIATAELSDDAAALLAALSLGERSGFDERHWRVLRATGTSHLVAISGMHIGLLGALVFLLTRAFSLWCLPRHWADYDLEIAAVACGLAAAGYAALAGFALPTQRALMMLLIALAVLVNRRTIGPLDALAGALLIVLALNPLASLTASFWLSFGAVAVLLLQAGGRQLAAAGGGRLRRSARAVRGFARMQLAVTLTLIPLLSAFFGELSLLAPLVNFVAIPVFSLLLVPLTLLGVLLGALGEQASVWLLPAAWLADLVWASLEHCAALKGAAIAVPAASAAAVALGAVAVVMAADWHRLPGRRLAGLALLPLLLPAESAIDDGRAEVLLLDVGHGLAVIIETARHRLLYDAGPLTRSGFDAGAEIVLPAIAARGSAPLDMLIVSHADNDHAGGAASIVTAFPDAEILKGPDVDAIDGRTCRAGQQWVWDGVEFAVLHPPPGYGSRGNDSSCVLKVSARHSALLLTGDIEAAAERTLLANAEPRADVVSVPHHGSATSSTPAFVQAVGARWALVSAGFENRWGFPRDEVRRRWQDAGASLRVTGDSGAIGLRLGEREIELLVERARRPRYWRDAARRIPGESPGNAL